MSWRVERVIPYRPDLAQPDLLYLQFYDEQGGWYAMDYDHHWVGGLGPDGQLRWTCGRGAAPESPAHIEADLEHPAFISRLPDGALLVSCFGNRRLYRIVPEERSARVLIDGAAHGLTDTGNGVVDRQGTIWLNEVTGCRIRQFDAQGNLLRTLGNGRPGFQRETVPLAEAQFNWIYDIRVGPDGNLYVLDSRNFALRMIDVEQGVVRLVAGTGQPGYAGDGGAPLEATFGGNPSEKFDGPWAISLDEEGNVFVGDTHNHVVRMLDRAANRITTIAGRPCSPQGERNEPTITDPLQLSLWKICFLNYFGGRLYVPDFDGDRVILRRI